MIARVREAAVAAVPHLLPFLDHEEPELRVHVARALGRYPTLRDETLPRLERALAREREPAVREALEATLAQLRAR